MSTKKQPDPKTDKAAAKAALKKGADELKKAQAAEKKAAAKPAVIDAAPLTVLPPPIKPARGDIGEIMRKCVVTEGPNHSIVSLHPETTKSEYLAIFDNYVGVGECWQIELGKLIVAGESLPCFKGKYVEAMAASGRSIDSVKAYRAVVVNTPPELLALKVPYTALRQTVKVRDPEKKAELIKEIAAAQKTDTPLTVDAVKKLADKAAPKKKTSENKAKPPEPVKLNADEKAMLKLFIEALKEPHKLLDDMSFLFDADKEDTAKLREMLRDFAKFAHKMEA